MNKPEITICLGSSCFSRGNKMNIQIIKSFIAENQLEEKVVFKGAHCFGECSEGPNLKINDTIYNHLDPEKTLQILREITKNLD